jgi:predicted MFS family arabinose efflux permease
MKPNRNAILLLAGDGLSAFGSWVDFLAILTLAAYQFHVSPYDMAAVSAAGLLPGILAAPAIGRWCDRANPQRILLQSIMARVATTGAILFCHDYTVFIALVGLRSVFATVAAPAINVMAMRCVAPAERPRFYSVLNVLNNTAKVLAPAIGTVSSSLTSEAVALGMSLVLSAASACAFAFIRLTPATKPSAAKAEPEPASIAPPDLLPLIWIAATCAFFIFMVNNLVPLVLAQSGFDKSLLGLLVSSSGAGNILSGLWLARRPASSAAPAGVVVGVGGLMRPAMLQALGFGVIAFLLWLRPGPVALLLPLSFFVIGSFSARYAIALSVHVARHHAASIGHTWGVLQAWQSAMIFVAPLVGAFVLDTRGPAPLFAFATGSAALSFALFLALRSAGMPRLQASV